MSAVYHIMNDTNTLALQNLACNQIGSADLQYLCGAIGSSMYLQKVNLSGRLCSPSRYNQIIMHYRYYVFYLLVMPHQINRLVISFHFSVLVVLCASDNDFKDSDAEHIAKVILVCVRTAHVW